MAEDHEMNNKIQQLAKSWKIDTNQKGWEDKLLKEYKSIKYTYIFSFTIAIILVIIASVITLVALFAEGSTIMGVEMTHKTFAAALIVTLSFSISMNTAGLKLRFERLKTFLFLKDMSQSS